MVHILVPEFIINQHKENKKAGDFPAVSLFLDLTGFSKMTSSLMSLGQYGAEILAVIMRELFDPMINTVYQHNGFIATTTGDAFTALFTNKKENNTDIFNSALSCAVRLQKIMAEKSHYVTPAGTFNLTAGVGISSGTVSWGIIQSAKKNRATYYFRGPPIDGCIECEELAAGGEIILDSSTNASLQDHIETEAVDEHYRLRASTVKLTNPVPLPTPTIDLDTATKFHPKSILMKDSTGEFRHVVNMFVSLPTVRTEPQLEIFVQSVFKLQNQYGGLLNRIDFGDKGAHLLIFWGAPVTYENDIARALNFVLDLQSETSIPIKAGITYRIAHAGFIGNELREDYTCYGQGVNLAARFMTKAGRGNIWVDEPIAKRTSHHFDLEFEGEYEFKGFERKQKTYSLYERLEKTQTIFNTPFSGREIELKQLQEISSPLNEASPPPPIVVSGSPGIGKSRLVHEFRLYTESALPNIYWAVGQSDQIVQNAFNPFQYWAKRYFEINENHAEARNKRNFNRKLDQLIASTQNPKIAAELDRTRSFLGSLVNLYWEDSLFEQLDPQGRYDNTIISVINLLKAESLLQPLVLLIEDLQWLDDDSKELLNMLAKEIHGTEGQTFPISIIGTTRDTTKLIFSNKTPYAHISLDKLTKPAIIEIAENIVKEKISPNLADAIFEFSEGNPFYTEQIILYLQENETLSKTENGWDLKEKTRINLPEDVRTLLIARLDQIEPGVKKVIQTASILGREVHQNLLAHMVSSEPNFQQYLNLAESTSFFTSINENEYIFKSNLLRDAAYQIQTVSQRKNLHAAAVQAYETLFSDDLSAFYPDLAHHSQEADLIPKAIDYLNKAGTLAEENYQNTQALNFFNRAIDLHQNTISEHYFDLVMRRQGIYNLIGDREGQLEDLKLTHGVAQTLKNELLEAKVRERYAMYHSLIGEYDEAILQLQMAIELAKSANAPQIEISSYLTWANCSRHMGDYKNATEQASLAISLAEEVKDVHKICNGLNSLSLIASQLGRFEEATEHLERSLEILKDLTSLNLQAQTLNNLGNIYGEIGDYSSAYDAYTQSFEIVQKTGNRMGECLVTSNLGWVAGQLGNFKSAREYLLHGIQISKEIEDVYIRAFSLVNLALFSTSKKEYQTASDYTDQALVILRETGHKPGEAIALAYKGHAQVGLGNYDQANACYQEAYTRMNELKQVNLSMEPLAGIAEVEYNTKGIEVASKTLTQILEHLGKGGTLDGIDQPFRVYNICSKLLLEQKHPDALNFLNNAHDLLQQKANKIKEDKSRISFLNQVPYHKELIDLFNQTTQQPKTAITS